MYTKYVNRVLQYIVGKILKIGEIYRMKATYFDDILLNNYFRIFTCRTYTMKGKYCNCEKNSTLRF